MDDSDNPPTDKGDARREHIVPGERDQVLTGDRSDRPLAEREAKGLPLADKDAEAAKLAPSPHASGTGTAAAPGPRISAEYNPGSGEYGASEHHGPAGTEKAVGAAHDQARSLRPISNAAAQHDDTDPDRAPDGA
mgnify:CR=1 FL=1